ncbi:MAG: benzoyl-CoA 2,3-epoxidase subunit BoxB, partial [Alphaproteobacteria bacterium]|nr:benzoyl-CoA 2,3-epoxidase subunit BoxB [Alphaproteobacteria bacterium]
MARIDYSERIPNNVNLSGDRRLQRALESWQPNYLEWWKEMGPVGTTTTEVYLRTAISAEPGGWAQFGHVKMPDYRWGIFLEPSEGGRTIGFGAHKGEPVWNEIPGEYRSALRR